jgi:hypothetical protein
VPDEGDVTQLLPDAEALPGLLRREDVLELFEAHRGPMAEQHVVRLEALGVGQPAEPLEVLGGQQASVRVEGLPGRLVVVRVVHPARHRRVVVPQDRHPRHLAHDLGALVRGPPVPYGVTEAVIGVDLLLLVGLQHRREGLVIGVNVAEDTETHGSSEAITPKLPLRELCVD